MPFGMELGLRPGDFVSDGDPAPPQKRGGTPNFRPCLLWPNGCLDQDATWYGGRPRPRQHCVRWRSRGRTPSPIFIPCLLWPNGWMNQDGTWHGGGPCATWGTSSPAQKGAEPHPQFLAHFYCGQKVECIKMPLGMEVGLSPGDIMLDGDPAPPQKGGGAPNFRPMSIAAKRQDASRCHLVWR